MHGTDYAIGFQTCITTVADAIDKLHTTAESHHRILLLEVMGRHAGWVALHAGVAGGADVVLIPERSYSLDGIVDTIRRREDRGSRFTIGVVAEGVQSPSGEMVYRARDGASHSWRLGGVCDQLAVSLADRTGSEVRSISLGHIQRGGSPVVADRLLATVLGAAAVEAVHQRQNGVMVGLTANACNIHRSTRSLLVHELCRKDHALLRAAPYDGDVRWRIEMSFYRPGSCRANCWAACSGHYISPDPAVLIGPGIGRCAAIQVDETALSSRPTRSRSRRTTQGDTLSTSTPTTSPAWARARAGSS